MSIFVIQTHTNAYEEDLFIERQHKCKHTSECKQMLTRATLSLCI